MRSSLSALHGAGYRIRCRPSEKLLRQIDFIGLPLYLSRLRCCVTAKQNRLTCVLPEYNRENTHVLRILSGITGTVRQNRHCGCSLLRQHVCMSELQRSVTYVAPCERSERGVGVCGNVELRCETKIPMCVSLRCSSCVRMCLTPGSLRSPGAMRVAPVPRALWEVVDGWLCASPTIPITFVLQSLPLILFDEHSPRYSMVLLRLSQRKIICSCIWLRAISVRLI